jgi:hypothetical protein
MVQAGSMSHCQPSSAITADCCASMSPVASQTIPARVTVKPTAQIALFSPTEASRDSVDSPDGQPVPLASKLHDIGRHTLYQVFLS